jgi:uncharacterized membrane protein
MKTGEFLNQLEHARIVEAIGAAEGLTSGEIRVFVSHKPTEDPVSAAQKQFTALGMEKTRERNGILLFVAPAAQKFAIIGDVGIHAVCGDEFWQSLAAELSGRFKEGEFTVGIVATVRRAGELLAKHFPRRPDDQNELSNEVGSD